MKEEKPKPTLAQKKEAYRKIVEYLNKQKELEKKNSLK